MGPALCNGAAYSGIPKGMRNIIVSALSAGSMMLGAYLFFTGNNAAPTARPTQESADYYKWKQSGPGGDFHWQINGRMVIGNTDERGGYLEVKGIVSNHHWGSNLAYVSEPAGNFIQIEIEDRNGRKLTQPIRSQLTMLPGNCKVTLFHNDAPARDNLGFMKARLIPILPEHDVSNHVVEAYSRKNR